MRTNDKLKCIDLTQIRNLLIRTACILDLELISCPPSVHILKLSWQRKLSIAESTQYALKIKRN